MNNPDPVLVQHYAVLKGISHQEARNKLKENYEVEVKKIPLRDLVLRTLTGMRAVAPKVDGMAQREQGTITQIRSLNERVDRIEANLRNLVDYSSQINYLIKEIRYLKLPWYRKLILKWQKKLR